MANTDQTPSHTLYVNNLNEKIKKDVLKKSILSVFSQFGKVIDIVACRGIRLRGQAWVVFEDVTAATSAMRQLQGFNFYDKPLRITFAKTKSDAIAKMDGSYTPRQKRKREETKTMEERQHVPSQAHAQPKVVKLIVNNIPNNVLFAQALPEEITQELLTNLFRPYAGFMEVRMVPSRKDIAFIDFLDEMSANMALQALNGYKITPADALHLTYAKK